MWCQKPAWVSPARPRLPPDSKVVPPVTPVTGQGGSWAPHPGAEGGRSGASPGRPAPRPTKNPSPTNFHPKAGSNDLMRLGRRGPEISATTWRHSLHKGQSPQSDMCVPQMCGVYSCHPFPPLYSSNLMICSVSALMSVKAFPAILTKLNFCFMSFDMPVA